MTVKFLGFEFCSFGAIVFLRWRAAAGWCCCGRGRTNDGEGPKGNRSRQGGGGGGDSVHTQSTLLPSRLASQVRARHVRGSPHSEIVVVRLTKPRLSFLLSYFANLSFPILRFAYACSAHPAAQTERRHEPVDDQRRRCRHSNRAVVPTTIVLDSSRCRRRAVLLLVHAAAAAEEQARRAAGAD